MIFEKLYNCTKIKLYKEYRLKCFRKYEDYNTEQLEHEKFSIKCKLEDDNNNSTNFVTQFTITIISLMVPLIFSAITYVQTLSESIGAMMISSKKFLGIDSEKQQEYIQKVTKVQMELVGNAFEYFLIFCISFILIYYLLFSLVYIYCEHRYFRRQTMLKAEMLIVNQLLEESDKPTSDERPTSNGVKVQARKAQILIKHK